MGRPATKGGAGGGRLRADKGWCAMVAVSGLGCMCKEGVACSGGCACIARCLCKRRRCGSV